ncbi:hypothetical protein RND81_05G264600 [Saponaria officinalis]|uniref:PWI domain-containing protein n=1 Tax=Saponaria officinalis TaxID=3572 RepID=A0AAW1KWY0_SAPOF
MSGGFFRGTSADQDTRFSNKQAKLLKTQKFPPELEHLVDVSKVKMDVMKPWIAKRVTEFLGGFEDEVLINFIYGLLEGKEINGKAVQIQLTGFMEKNTSKFMKELWALLLSAQNNASGVPQQFLDAKEEETKKKKAETDRIANEIQRRKDNEAEQEKKRKMDGGLDTLSAEDSIRRRERGSDSHSGDANGADVQKNGFRGRNRSPRLPYPPDRSPSPLRGRHSRSVSKSYSNSRSYSKERGLSKSTSPRPRKRSVSPVAVRRTPQRSASPRKPTIRESVSPRRRYHSRRSLSRTRHRSPSPIRRRFRSPPRRRSPSPSRRRSRSPIRRRSPVQRRRSPSPWRRRSPSPRRRRSPSPIRQRRRRSTSSPRSLSPIQRRSPSPVRRRFQSPVRRRSPYPVRRRSPSPDRRGSPSPRRRRSPSPVRRRSPSRRSPVRVRRRSPVRSPSRSVSSASRSSPSLARDSSASPMQKKSPRLRSTLHGSPRESPRLNDCAEPVPVARRQSMAMSPQRDHSDISRSRRKVPSVSPSPEKLASYVDSPKQKARSSGDNRRSYKRAEDQLIRDGSRSPLPQMKGQKAHQSSPNSDKEEFESFREKEQSKHKSTEKGSDWSHGGKKREGEQSKHKSTEKGSDWSHGGKKREGEQSKHKSTEKGSDWSHGVKKREPLDEPPGRLPDTIEQRQKDIEMASWEVSPKEANATKKSSHKVSVPQERQVTSNPGDASKSDQKRSSLPKDARDNSRPNALVSSHKKRRSPSVSSDSGSEGSDKRKFEVTEKRKHRRSSRREVASDDTSSESEIEDRKEVKKRKKEEKKLRKEERRRRRDERRHRREEKRASKRKRKSKDADVLSSDLKKNEMDDKALNGESMAGKYSSEEEETESQKKKLEIELREKALESLRAKKGLRH